ncbi:unnamed protein product, partial [Prorocentrum cordatum]
APVFIQSAPLAIWIPDLLAESQRVEPRPSPIDNGRFDDIVEEAALGPAAADAPEPTASEWPKRPTGNVVLDVPRVHGRAGARPFLPGADDNNVRMQGEVGGLGQVPAPSWGDLAPPATLATCEPAAKNRAAHPFVLEAESQLRGLAAHLEQLAAWGAKLRGGAAVAADAGGGGGAGAGAEGAHWRSRRRGAAAAPDGAPTLETTAIAAGNGGAPRGRLRSHVAPFQRAKGPRGAGVTNAAKRAEDLTPAGQTQKEEGDAAEVQSSDEVCADDAELTLAALAERRQQPGCIRTQLNRRGAAAGRPDPGRLAGEFELPPTSRQTGRERPRFFRSFLPCVIELLPAGRLRAIGPMSDGCKNFLRAPEAKSGDKRQKKDDSEGNESTKRDELILLAQVAAESRAHAASLYRTWLVPGEVGEQFFDNMKQAVANYEKATKGKKGHKTGIPCQRALIAAFLTAQTHFTDQSKEYKIIEETLKRFPEPVKVGRDVLEFWGYEAREKGHRFRYRLGEDVPAQIKEAVGIVTQIWEGASGEEILGQAPANKRERNLQGRIKRMK